VGHGISSQAAEFSLWHRILINFRRILQNFAKVENSSVISMIFDLMTYFYQEKIKLNCQKLRALLIAVAVWHNQHSPVLGGR